MLALIGLLGGIVLAFRFNVFILLPAIVLGWGLTIWGGIVHADSGYSIAFHLVGITVLLQVGYVVGILLMWAFSALRKTVAVPAAGYNRTLPS